MKFITKKDIVMPKRKKRSHKGDSGRVLIIGGSREYIGALALAGLAALRSGADLVTIAAPSKVAWAVNCLSPDLITIKLDGSYIEEKHKNKLLALADKSDAVLIGSGIGMKKQTQLIVKTLIRQIKKPIVIDADAIKTISLKDAANTIITPHKKEFELLLQNSGIREKDIKRSIDSNVILLKGSIDRIITKKTTFYNKTGNPGMTVAGTGDVLAGLCTGFLAQGLSLQQSAVNSAYLCGIAGDILKNKKKGFAYIASDIVAELKRIRKTSA